MKMVEKLQKRIQEGKKNNKGFSLVELIIVIAIMAILIGIVGMNVLPQIENARQSKDLQVLSAYLTESVEALTQNASRCTVDTFTITIDITAKTVGITNSDKGGSSILATFLELSSLKESGNTFKFESSAAKDMTKITIDLNLKTTSGGDAADIAVLKVVGDGGKLVDPDGLTSK